MGLLLSALLVPAAPAFAAPVADSPRSGVEFDAPVHAMVAAGSAIVVGGEFTHAIVGGNWVRRDHLAAVDAASGALLAWDPGADATVTALAADGADVYAGGEFTELGGEPRHHLGRLNLWSDEADGRLAPVLHGRVNALAVGSGRLYVGGDLHGVGDQPVANLAAFSLGSGELDTDWAPQADKPVHALAATAGRIYLGGAFESLNGVPDYDHFAAVDPVTGWIDPDFDPAVHVLIRGLTVTAEGLYVALGGQGGQVVKYTVDGVRRWEVTTDGDVQSVVELGDTVYAGGHFDFVCRTARTGLHGLCLDGSVERHKLLAVTRAGALLPWAPDANGVVGVTSMAAAGGRLSVGGTFTTPGLRFAQFG